MSGSDFDDLEPIVRISIRRKDQRSGAMFGSGVAHLCKGVRDLGSLNRAAKTMNMSYSKAWRIIKATEEMLGVTLLDRDGARGSELTEEGRGLLECYEQLLDSLRSRALDEYAYLILRP